MIRLAAAKIGASEHDPFDIGNLFVGQSLIYATPLGQVGLHGFGRPWRGAINQLDNDPLVLSQRLADQPL